MNIAVIGAGYVGTTTAVSFAHYGHCVTLVDKDLGKVSKLKQSIVPFYEEGIKRLLEKHVLEQRLSISSDVKESITKQDVIVIAVGTPSLPDGKANLSYVKEVAREIGRTMEDYKVIVTKSTVPVGTGLRIKSVIQEELAIRNKTVPFDVVSNPEFLREGKALQDALSPERIVIGSESNRAKEKMNELYKTFQKPTLHTTINDAEMIKYASNAFLATKISFMNELARLCEETDANITHVAKGMGLDSRIGEQFLQAGIGYGGSCFPKDLQALTSLGMEKQKRLSILEAVTHVNETQISWFLEKVRNRLGSLHQKRIAILGLSFKPGTDDIREAASLKIIKHLQQDNAIVTAFDPQATFHVRAAFPQVQYTSTPLEAVQGADAILLVTEWEEIVNMDWKQAIKHVHQPFLFDGRNVLSSNKMKQLGFIYHGVGLSE